MGRYNFPFTRVIVADAMSCSAAGTVALLSRRVSPDRTMAVSSLAALRAEVARSAGQRVLVVTELATPHEQLSDGIATLSWLGALSRTGLCRVMVLTALEDPLLLRVALSHCPAVIALRREPLSVLQECFRLADTVYPATLLSPGAGERIAKAPRVTLTPALTRRLLSYVEGMSLGAAGVAVRLHMPALLGPPRRLTKDVSGPPPLPWLLQSGGGHLKSRYGVNMDEEDPLD